MRKKRVRGRPGAARRRKLAGSRKSPKLRTAKPRTKPLKKKPPKKKPPKKKAGRRRKTPTAGPKWKRKVQRRSSDAFDEHEREMRRLR